MQVCEVGDWIYIRQNPSLRTIFVLEDPFTSPVPRFLSFPYIEFVIKTETYLNNCLSWIRFNQFQIFFSKNSEFSQLCLPPLPDVSIVGSVCLGTNIINAHHTKQELIKNILEAFWSTPFVAFKEANWTIQILNHYLPIFTSSLGTHKDIIKNWESLNKTNFIFNIPYLSSPHILYLSDSYHSNTCHNNNNKSWIDWKDWIKE